MSAGGQVENMDRLPLWLTKPAPRIYRAPAKHRPSSYHSPSFSNEFLRVLGDEILAFAEWVQPTDHERVMRQRFAQRVESIVTFIWPEASVQVFGSSQTGLALPVSDVDFVVEGISTKRAVGVLLQDLGEALQEHGMANVRVIGNAKVPLIKFVDPQTHLRGDVSFGVRNATESVTLVKQYLMQYLAAKPLVLVLKTLLHQNDLNVVHTGGLSSYAITLLVVTYLRVVELTASEEETAALQELDPLAVGKAFVGFMKYFALTDLRDHVFTPARDDPITISRKSIYAGRGAPFALEDPLDPDNDITRGTFLVSQVQLLLWYSLQALVQYQRHRPGGIPSILSSVINPRDFHFLSRLSGSTEGEERNDARGD